MYAIIQDGGKQYRVQQGQTLYLETRVLPEGERSIELDRVLMVGDGASSKIGAPYIEGASVTAKLEGRVRGPKLEIVKFRRRKGYKLHKGHRQNLLKVSVEKINA
jgi:large subunit ribosomal protein L21